MLIVADENIPFVRESFGTLGDIITLSGRKITPTAIKDADVLVVRSITRVGQDLLKNSRVKFIGTATIGTDHIDLDYLKKRDIAFANAPGSNANSVAEYIVAGLLVLAEKNNFKLKNKSIGIIGVGNVGSRVAVKTEALGMNVLLNDPPLARLTDDKKYLPLENLMDCDIITLHVPLIDSGPNATRHMANRDFLAQLKPSTVFINTSRGPVVDGNALKEILKDKRLAGTILDVWENEPNIDIELLKLVSIGTPHIAGYSYDGKVNGTYIVYTGLCRYLGQRPVWNPASDISGNRRISINPNNTDRDDESVLSETVKQAYDILEDDRNLRKILDMPYEKSGEYFDRLRKEYHKRREFQSIEVHMAEPDKELEEMIAKLGFKEK